MSKKVYVIAEIGVNHEGEVDKCTQLIEEAVACGVDAVKLQTVDADANYVPGTKSYEIFKRSELTRDETARMFELATRLGVDIFTTCGDLPTAKWVDELNPSAWKVSSGLLTHIPMIRSLTLFGRPMLISTGMATVDEIDLAIETVESEGQNRISLFQCTSLYPAPPESLNLATIRSMKKRYGYEVGFSDHSIGSNAVFLSVAAGAAMIEKHFTFDMKRNGFDHAISLNADGLRDMVDRVQLAETMMGSSEKELLEQVATNRKSFLRTIVTTQPVRKGDIFTLENISIKRPTSSERTTPPSRYYDFVGKVSARNITENEAIVEEDCIQLEEIK
jgi:sialic acid synthase SpsE